MKKISTLIFFLISLAVYGQNSDFELGFSYNSNITGEMEYYSNTNTLKINNSINVYRYGYGLNMIAKFRLNKHFSFQTGINYLFNGTKSVIYNYFANPLPERQRIRYYRNSKNICLPLLINFRWSSTKKHSFYTVGGFNISYLFENKIQVRNWIENGNYFDEYFDYKDEYKTWNINPSIGIGYEYKIKNKFKIFAQPNLEINLLKTNGTSLPSKSMYSLGVNVGFIIL